MSVIYIFFMTACMLKEAILVAETPASAGVQLLADVPDNARWSSI